MGSKYIAKYLLTVATLVLLLAGCASTGPLPEDATKDYKDRLQTLTDGGVGFHQRAVSK
jgi:hypothetical protein